MFRRTNGARERACLAKWGYNTGAMNLERTSVELTILEENLQALKTLIRYESDLEKLKMYKRELDLVIAELDSERKFLSRRAHQRNSVSFQQAKPFSLKRPTFENGCWGAFQATPFCRR